MTRYEWKQSKTDRRFFSSSNLAAAKLNRVSGGIMWGRRYDSSVGYWVHRLVCAALAGGNGNRSGRDHEALNWLFCCRSCIIPFGFLKIGEH